MYVFKQHSILKTFSKFHFCCLERIFFSKGFPVHTIRILGLSTIIIYAIQIRSNASIVPPSTMMINCTVLFVRIIVPVPFKIFLPL